MIRKEAQLENMGRARLGFAGLNDKKLIKMRFAMAKSMHDAESLFVLLLSLID